MIKARVTQKEGSCEIDEVVVGKREEGEDL